MIQQFLNSFLTWWRVGGRADIEVFRQASEQQIADAPSDEVCHEVVLVQPIKDLQRVWIDVAAGDRVLSPRDDGRFHHRG